MNVTFTLRDADPRTDSFAALYDRILDSGTEYMAHFEGEDMVVTREVRLIDTSEDVQTGLRNRVFGDGVVNVFTYGKIECCDDEYAYEFLGYGLFVDGRRVGFVQEKDDSYIQRFSDKFSDYVNEYVGSTIK